MGLNRGKLLGGALFATKLFGYLPEEIQDGLQKVPPGEVEETRKRLKGKYLPQIQRIGRLAEPIKITPLRPSPLEAERALLIERQEAAVVAEALEAAKQIAEAEALDLDDEEAIALIIAAIMSDDCGYCG